MPKHIVVFEDDTDLRYIIVQILENAGYRVTGADRLISLDVLLSYEADCFVIDEHLPGTTGHIICILLKAKLATRHIPVILISTSEKLAHHASLCEADAYLPKPFSHISEVVTVVSRMTG